MAMTRLLAALFLLATVLAAIGALAQTLNPQQTLQLNLSPVTADPTAFSSTVGTTPDAAKSGTAGAAGARIDRLCNTHASQNLCAYWVAPAVGCGSTRTCDGSSTDGAIVLPSTCWGPPSSAALTLCVVGSAASTTYNLAVHSP